VFPGTGIQDNFADKARKLGIPVWRFGSSGHKRRPSAENTSSAGAVALRARPVHGFERMAAKFGGTAEFHRRHVATFSTHLIYS
jgi:hypothetical protein